MGQYVALAKLGGRAWDVLELILEGKYKVLQQGKVKSMSGPAPKAIISRHHLTPLRPSSPLPININGFRYRCFNSCATQTLCPLYTGTQK